MTGTSRISTPDAVTRRWRAPKHLSDKVDEISATTGLTVNAVVNAAVAAYVAPSPTSVNMLASNGVAAFAGRTAYSSVALSPTSSPAALASAIRADYEIGYATVVHDHYASAVSALAGTQEDPPCGPTRPTTSPATRRPKSARTAPVPDAAPAADGSGTPGTAGRTSARRSSSTRRTSS